MSKRDPRKTLSEQLTALEHAAKWSPKRRRLMQDVRSMMAAVDSARLEALRSQYAERIEKAGADSRYKYFDVAYYTLEKLMLARELGLDNGPPRRVLDIGCGAGHFALVCRFHGHEVVGIDVENPVYAGIASCLGIDRSIVRVEPETPLPSLDGGFDVITACNITFNEKRNGRGAPRTYWSLPEWRFFLNDLIARQLRCPGTLYLKLNKQLRGSFLGFKRLAYDREALALAARNGADVSPLDGTIRMQITSCREIV